MRVQMTLAICQLQEITRKLQIYWIILEFFLNFSLSYVEWVYVVLFLLNENWSHFQGQLHFLIKIKETAVFSLI